MEASRGEKTICVPFESEAHYEGCVLDKARFRQALEEIHRRHPELFPSRFEEGFVLHDRYFSERLQLWTRRIRVKATGEVFGVRPSLATPYMVAMTEEVEKGLFLRHWGVPHEAIAYVCGRSASFWYRAEISLGRASIVGTTVKAPERLPQDLVADEKHTRLLRNKVFVPTVVGRGCILGATLTESASEEALLKGYGEFAEEARQVAPTYEPETVCTDGWDATQNAFKTLFKGICVILCFLHSVLKIAERCARAGELRQRVLDKAWNIYHAPDRTTFSQRVRRFREWATAHLPDGGLREMVLKLCSKRREFLKAFDHPGAHRTSNAADRLID